MGDNVYFAIRARDVLTEHHPLLGTWTSASVSAGTDFNNPGPLLFDLLAVPAKLGDEVGVAVLVLALAWSQPLVEQLTSDGQGNLSRLATSAGGSDETVGPELGTRVVAGVVAAPP